jgi:hypothetical protein
MKSLPILTACLVVLLCAEMAHGETVTKEKKISGRFPASKGKLIVDNRYGKLTVNTWDRNELTVDITVTAKAFSENAATELLNKVSIVEPGDKSTGVYYKTEIGNGRLSANRGEFRIDYIINMPRRHTAELINKYGDIEISDAEGKVRIDLDYGSLKTGTLEGGDKEIDVSYGNASIVSIGTARVTSSYANLSIQKAGSLDVSSKSGNTRIGTVHDLDIDQKYGDLKVGSVNRLSGNVEYGGLIVDKVMKSLQMTLKYSPGAKYGYIGPDVDKISVSSAYSNLYFHFDNAASLSTEVAIRYGRVNNSASNISLTESESDKTGLASRYTGKVGRGSGTMELDVIYGNVVFK